MFHNPVGCGRLIACLLVVPGKFHQKSLGERAMHRGGAMGIEREGGGRTRERDRLAFFYFSTMKTPWLLASPNGSSKMRQ